MAEGRALRFPMMQMLRSAHETVVDQLRRARGAGVTFKGKRDLYDTCGYERYLRLLDYRDRYQRGDIASRVVEAFPEATWRGNGQDCVYDSDDSQETTPFEKAWNDLNKRLKVWSVFYRADVLAGLGHYAVILIGAPGKYHEPLPDSLKPTDIAFLQPFCQEDAPIVEYETSGQSPRCGLPISYQLRRTSTLRKAIEQTRAPLQLDLTKQVHYTRILHIADGKLDDDVFGIPRLERVWNRLDDLEKVIGAGAEAFWMRAHQGIQFDLDPEVELEEDEAARLKAEIRDYIHRLSRTITTRGVTATPFGSDVADFDKNVGAIISLISATTKIPQRLLLGSERGELASTQDRDTWRERVQDRRTRFAEPEIVRPFVEQLVQRGALPKPQQEVKATSADGKPITKKAAGGKFAFPGADKAKPDPKATGADAKPTFPPARAAAIRPMTPAAADYFPSDTDKAQLARGDNPTGGAVVEGELVNDDARDESPNFKVFWDEVLDTPAKERLEAATLAKALGATVVTDAEIRDVFMGMEPMSEDDIAAAQATVEAEHAREIEKVQARGPAAFGESAGPGKGVPASKSGNGKPAPKSAKPAPRAAEDGEHSGLFIYLKLDDDAAKQLALKGDGAEEPSTLHVTVAYCDGDFATAVPLIRSVAEKSPMLHGAVTGIGTFAPSIASEGRTVLWAFPEVDGLEALHDAVLDTLEFARVGERTARDYRPHITLAYVDADAEMALPLIPRVSLYFSQLCVRKGDQEESFWLNRGAGMLGAPDLYSAVWEEGKHPRTPKGSAKGGQFVSGTAEEVSGQLYDATDKWRNKLPIEQREAFRDYTSDPDPSVNHDNINRLLRGEAPKGKGADVAVLHERARLIQEALANAPKVGPEKVYRGLSKEGHAIFANVEVGKTITLNGFQSTDLERNPVFHKKGGAALVIRNPRGATMEGISLADNEREFLLPHGAKYKLLSKTKTEYVLEMLDGPIAKIPGRGTAKPRPKGRSAAEGDEPEVEVEGTDDDATGDRFFLPGAAIVLDDAEAE